MEAFEKDWPVRFNSPIPKKIITIVTSKKSLKVGDKYVYDINLIYSRVLGLQQSRNIDLAEVLKHELAPFPTSMF